MRDVAATCAPTRTHPVIREPASDNLLLDLLLPPSRFQPSPEENSSARVRDHPANSGRNIVERERVISGGRLTKVHGRERREQG